jgi:lysine-specific demethylase 8
MGGGPHAMPRELWDQLHALIGHCQAKWREQLVSADADADAAARASNGQPPASSTTSGTDGQQDDQQQSESNGEEEEQGDEAESSFRPTLRPVERIRRPSMERFLREYMQKGIPVIITGGMDGWPAMNERAWANLNYLKVHAKPHTRACTAALRRATHGATQLNPWPLHQSIAGPRTVPVEVGTHYLHPEWSQKLMTFAEFIDNHVTKSHQAPATSRGYLAQALTHTPLSRSHTRPCLR